MFTQDYKSTFSDANYYFKTGWSMKSQYQLNLKPKLLSAAIAATAALPGGAYAANDMLVEEVIVTVDRREQNLQDFAGTVQAFTGEELESLGVTNDFRTLQNAVTGLHISNQEGKLEVFLRGIGSSDSDFASDPSVATHYNGIYLPRPRSIGPMFFDVERVEVNKGPQGTVRGRNATGGTINIISKRPDMDEASADLKVGFGDLSQRHFEGVFNIPAGETFAARIAYYQEQRDSYMDNAFTGSADLLDSLAGQGSRIADAFGGNIEAPGELDDQALRVSLLWEPNDNFSAYVLADKVEQRGSGTPGAFTGRSLSAGFDIDDLDDPYEQYFVNEGAMENDIDGFATTLTYMFDGWGIEYNGSIREYDFTHRNAAREWQIGMDFPNFQGDTSDSARAEAEAVILGNEQTAYGNFTQAETSETTVHEIRVFADNDQRFRWSAGYFNLQEDFSWASQDFSHGWWGDCDWFQDGTVCGWLNGLSSENRNDDSEVKSQAVYFDGTFDLNETFRLKAGIRWTDEEKTANEANAQYQLVLTDEALTALGLSGPQDIVMGTNGLELTGAGDRPSNIVPLGNSADTRQYFLDGIASWGANDNFDELIAWDPTQFQVVISSDFNSDGLGNVTKKYEDNYVDWRLGFETDLSEDNLLYGTVSTGTRSGGINRPLPGADSSVDVSWDPEELVVYEVGSKNVFDWGVLNGAMFYYDYKEKVLQGLVSVNQPGCDPTISTCSVNHIQNQNAADATLWGLELDGSVYLPAAMKLNWNLLYLNAEFGDGSEVIDTRQPGQALVDIDGNKLPNTSEWNFNLALEQTLDFDWGSADWKVSGNYRSEFFLSPFNSKGYDADGNSIPLEQMTVATHWLIDGAGFNQADGNFLLDKVPSTFIINLNAGINFGSDEQYRVEGWVSNVTDETYSTKAFINDSVNIRFLNPPRMWGVRVAASF